MDKALQTMIDNMPEKTGKSLGAMESTFSQEVFFQTFRVS